MLIEIIALVLLIIISVRVLFYLDFNQNFRWRVEPEVTVIAFKIDFIMEKFISEC